MSTILALDIATKTGWCRGDFEAGTEDFSVKRGESGGMRFVRFRSWLDQVSVGPTRTTVDLIVYEEINFFRGIDASLVYGGLLGILQEHCTRYKIDYKGVMPTELKKWATGKGSGKKEAMVAEAHRRWPEFKGDDNEADARLLWVFAKESGWG